MFILMWHTIKYILKLNKKQTIKLKDLYFQFSKYICS